MNYAEKVKFNWTKYNGTPISDLAQYIKNHINNYKWDYEIYIGTDAQRIRKRNSMLFSSAICIYKIGMGGHIIYSKHKRNDIKNKEEKLKMEVWSSIQIAQYLTESGILIHPDILQVHIDLSPKKDNFSNKLYQEMMGWVIGMGFHCEAKPNAAAATHCADHIVKNKGIAFYEYEKN